MKRTKFGFDFRTSGKAKVTCITAHAQLLLMLLMMTTGCAHQPAQPVNTPNADAAINCEARLQPEQQVHLDLVDRYMKQQLFYAALAQLESMPVKTEAQWLRRGQLMALTGRQEESKAIFLQLVEQCQSGESYHGLGMLLLKTGEVETAVENFRQARDREPASASIRNDLGYALLLLGRGEEAIIELRTAVELSSGANPSLQNLAIAYLYMHNTEGITWLQERYDLSNAEYAFAAAKAKELFNER